jgi:hypothetical protein
VSAAQGRLPCGSAGIDAGTTRPFPVQPVTRTKIAPYPETQKGTRKVPFDSQVDRRRLKTSIAGL